MRRWGEARAWYGRALPALEDARQRGILFGHNLATIDQARAGIRECEKAAK